MSTYNTPHKSNESTKPRRHVPMRVTFFVLIGALFAWMSLGTFALFTDISEDAPYNDSVKRISALGIMNGVAQDVFGPDTFVTREQFAKIIISATALDEEASALKGATVFPDVKTASWSSGFINSAVKRGLVKGMLDGNFHPQESITFAQACTIFVKSLNYTDEDVPGLWPLSYTEKAISLGLSDGVALAANDKLPRWAIAMMVDDLMKTPLKKNTPNEAEKKFYEKNDFFVEALLLGDSSTMESLSDTQILTDKGIYYIRKSAPDIQIGNVYRLKVKDGVVEKIFDSLYPLRTLSVSDVDGNKITYRSGKKMLSFTLPDRTAYYFNGKKQNVDALPALVKRGMNIILSEETNGLGYYSGVITQQKDFKLGTYVDALILGNAKTDSILAENQVQSDIGVFDLPTSDLMLELGAKYNLIVKDNGIVKVVEKISNVKLLPVENVVDSVVYYRDGIQKQLTLPANTTYYYNGQKTTYAAAKNALKANSSLVLGLSDNNVGYEYAVVLDPLYGTPQMAQKTSPTQTVYGDLQLLTYSTIIKEGKTVSARDVENKDLLYRVTDYFGNNPYIVVVNTRAEGRITNILPDKASAKTLQVENKNYELSKYVSPSSLNGSAGSFKVDDRVSALLGYDDKIVRILPLTYKTGPYADHILLGEASYNDALEGSQLLTNKGTYNNLSGKTSLEPGNTYKIVVDETVVPRIGDKLYQMTYFSVDYAIGNVISYTKDDKNETLSLPDYIDYYYKGQKVSFTTVKSNLAARSTIALARYPNTASTGNDYQYGVLFDPVYSAPNVVEGNSNAGILSNYSDILTAPNRIVQIFVNGTLLKNGEYLEKDDVLYKVSDIFGDKFYAWAVRNPVSGTLNAFGPSRLSPKILTIGTKTYPLSKYLDAASMNDLIYSSNVDIGDWMTVILDKNGEIIQLTY